MKRSSAWYVAVLLVMGCGGDSGAGEEEMAQTAEAMAEMTSPGPNCVVMGDLEERQSPLQELRFSAGGGDALLCYGAPSARGREIMGGLVPYDELWRLGANEPTTVHLTAASSFGGVPLQAGSYSLYAIPGEDEWEFHLNSNYERWGIPIDAEVRATEVGRFTALPSAAAGMVETMTFELVDRTLRLSWENTQVDIPLGR